MVWSVRQQRRLIWLMTGATATAAVGVLIVGFVQPVTVTTSPVREHSPVEPPGDRRSAAVDLASFKDLVAMDLQRPLFDAPKVAVQPPPPPPPPPLRLRLLGTVIEPGNSQAIIQTSDNRIEFSREGDTLESATLTAIREDVIEVRYHGQTLTLATENR